MLGVLREEPSRTGEPSQSPEQSPELSPQPGVADLDALCARVRAAGPEVTYRTVGDLDALDRSHQLTVYRIAQEALTNTLKHAGADTRAQLTVAVAGSGETPQVRVRVEDSGRRHGTTGEVGTAPRNSEGQGIAGMRERAALYNGWVTASGRPGGGWLVEAVLNPAQLAVAAS